MDQRLSFDQEIDRRGTSCFKWDFIKEVFGANDVLPLWVADMDFPVAPSIVEEFKKRVEHGIFGYTGRGESFYNAVIDWQKMRHEWNIRRDWISTCPGIVSGINTCIQAFSHPGDKVIIQPPVYYPFFEAVKSNGRQLVLNPLQKVNDRYTFDFDDLRKKIDDRTKMLILCSPHNPVGRVWKKQELETLAEICEGSDILIVSDEIHEDIVFKGNQHIPIASLSPQIANRTVTLIAPSKTFNIAGLLSSVAIIPNKKLIRDYDHQLAANGIGLGNVFGILGLEVAYTTGESWLQQVLEYIQLNIDFTLEFLKQRLPTIQGYQPEGTFLLWLDCKGLNMEDAAMRKWFIHQAKVGLDAGTVFGPGGEHYQRMNVGCPRSILEKALLRIENACKKQIEEKKKK